MKYFLLILLSMLASCTTSKQSSDAKPAASEVQTAISSKKPIKPMDKLCKDPDVDCKAKK